MQVILSEEEYLALKGRSEGIDAQVESAVTAWKTRFGEKVTSYFKGEWDYSMRASDVLKGIIRIIRETE